MPFTPHRTPPESANRASILFSSRLGSSSCARHIRLALVFNVNMSEVELAVLSRELEIANKDLRCVNRRLRAWGREQREMVRRGGMQSRAFEVLRIILRRGPGPLDCARRGFAPDCCYTWRTSRLSAVRELGLQGLVHRVRDPDADSIVEVPLRRARILERNARRWILEHAVYLWMYQMNRTLGICPSSRSIVQHYDEVKIDDELDHGVRVAVCVPHHLSECAAGGHAGMW